MIKLLVLLIHIFVVKSVPDCKFKNCQPCTVNAGDCVWCAGVNATNEGAVVWGVCANNGNCPPSAIKSSCDTSLGCSSIKKEKECSSHSLCKWCGSQNDDDSNNFCSTTCLTQAPCHPNKNLSSCITSPNCGWCPSIQVCLNIYESPLCSNETMIFDEKTEDSVVQLNKDCKLKSCDECVEDPLCSWCEGNYSTNMGNYSWGVCYSQIGSFCPDNGGESRFICAPRAISFAPVLPDPDYNSIITENDVCPDYINCSSCLKNVDCGWCTGSKDINVWGECRSITKKKNGEIGENFCLRNGGTWKTNSCEDSTNDINQLVTNILIPRKVITRFEAAMASQMNITDLNLQVFNILAKDQTNNTSKVVAIIEKNNTNIFLQGDFLPYKNQLCNATQIVLQKLLTINESRFTCELETINNNYYKGTSKIVVALNIQGITNQKN